MVAFEPCVNSQMVHAWPCFSESFRRRPLVVRIKRELVWKRRSQLCSWLAALQPSEVLKREIALVFQHYLSALAPPAHTHTWKRFRTVLKGQSCFWLGHRQALRGTNLFFTYNDFVVMLSLSFFFFRRATIDCSHVHDANLIHHLTGSQ